MNLIDYITQASQTYLLASGPGMLQLGHHMFLALVTIMLVMLGIEMMYSPSGLDAGLFARWALSAGIAFTLLQFYLTPIPFVGYSFSDFIILSTRYLVQTINGDSVNHLLATINTLQKQIGTTSIVAAAMSTYYANAVMLIQVYLAFWQGTILAIVAYGEVAAAATAIFGPLFIPFLIVDNLDWLFWGWLRAFIGFCFYKVVAAAVLSIMGNIYMAIYTTLMPINIVNIIQKLPVITLFFIVNVFIIFQIPWITTAILSGNTHGAGQGMYSTVGRFIGRFL